MPSEPLTREQIEQIMLNMAKEIARKRDELWAKAWREHNSRVVADGTQGMRRGE
jgi:hypothetical protein